MGAIGWRVKAGVELGSDGLALPEVFSDDLGNIFRSQAAVPGFFRREAHRNAHIALPLTGSGDRLDAFWQVRFLKGIEHR
jgi:hypothetical protein